MKARIDKTKLNEKEIDETVIKHADKDDLWTALGRVPRKVSREEFLAILAKVPDVPPDENDRIE